MLESQKQGHDNCKELRHRIQADCFVAWGNISPIKVSYHSPKKVVVGKSCRIYNTTHLPQKP